MHAQNSESFCGSFLAWGVRLQAPWDWEMSKEREEATASQEILATPTEFRP